MNTTSEKDLSFMTLALAEAHEAFVEDEVPVGAVLVNEHGEVLARNHNRVEQSKTQVAHAELLVLTDAGKKQGDWRLEKCWLYVTLEPCAMCFNAIVLSRLDGVVYGAASPLFGYHLDKSGLVSLYNDSHLKVIGGVSSDESSLLLKKFFRKKRGEKSGSKSGKQRS
jgi:tRNA(adenine34) deaminase